VVEANEMHFMVWVVTQCTVIQKKYNIIYYKRTYMHT